MKKLISFVLSFSLLIFPSTHTEGCGCCGDKMRYDPTVVAAELNRQGTGGKRAGRPNGIRVYKHGNVFITTLPNPEDVARRINDILDHNSLSNYNNHTRHTTALRFLSGVSIICGILSWGPFIGLEAADKCEADVCFWSVLSVTLLVSIVLEIVGIIIIRVSCKDAGIVSKDKEMREICSQLNSSIKNRQFMGNNVLVMEFDKRDCDCCRKCVYIGFERIDGLDPLFAPIIGDEHYFDSVVFEVKKRLTEGTRSEDTGGEIGESDRDSVALSGKV